MKHTPGPWAYDGDVDVDAKGYPICFLKVPSRAIGCNVPKKGLEQLVGNGHIIAAAPEMLEALKIAKHIFETQCPSQTENMKLIYDAIAKAEGK